MALIEAKPHHRCDADCGASITLQGGEKLEDHGWVVLGWHSKTVKGRHIELCSGCGQALQGHHVMKKALHNTSVAGKYGPEADCG